MEEPLQVGLIICSACSVSVFTQNIFTFPLYNKALEGIAQSQPSLRSSSSSFISSGLSSENLETDVSKYSNQSEETLPESGKDENVVLLDENAGYEDGPQTYTDPARTLLDMQDTSLSNFMSRPIILANIDWAPNVPLAAKINPWTLFFENPRISNRISNFRLLRATLHIKVVVNGNQFYYGRAMMSYLPLARYDLYAEHVENIEMQRMQESQRPHIFIDPNTSTGGELVLPFFTPRQALSIPAGEWDEMGELTIVDLISTLKHVQGSTEPITIRVMAHASDVVLSIPTQADAKGLTNQSADEYGVRRSMKASEIATAVATASGSLSMVPTIGPFARATSMVSTAVSKVLGAFGYSKPAMIDNYQYRPQFKSSLANCDIEDDVHRLTVDTKQELTIDPRVTGADITEDELTIQSIARRPSWLGNFEWDGAAAPGKILYAQMVDPMYAVKDNAGSRLCYPAMSAAAMPFKWWRGSIVYRFQVVCSTFHRGRIRIVWEPRGSVLVPAGGFELNLPYSVIVDITETTDFCVTIGWGQTTAYRNVAPTDNITYALENPNPTEISLGFPNTDAVPYSNGVLYVEAFTSLTKPLTQDEGDTISINVFAHAGDDFELAGPQGDAIQNATFRNKEWTNQSMDDGVAPSDVSKNMGFLIPDCPENIATFGPLLPSSDPTNHIHFGERISSFRTLLKRYCFDEFIPVVHTGIGSTPSPDVDSGSFGVIREIYPSEAGYLDNVLQNATTTPYQFTTDGDPYWVKANPLVVYLSRCFAARRGGMRWMMVWDSGNGNDARAATYMYSREADSVGVPDVPRNSYDSVSRWPNYTDEQVTVTQRLRQWCGAGISGSDIGATVVNPSTCVEIPYYSKFRFQLPRHCSQFTNDGEITRNENVLTFRTLLFRRVSSATISRNDHFKSYCAAAEDFQLTFWVGMPPIYFEGGQGRGTIPSMEPKWLVGTTTPPTT